MRSNIVLRVSVATLLVLCLLAGLPAAAVAQGPYTLTLLHTGDTHAHLEAFTPSGSTPQGGVARRYTAIQSVRAEGGNVLLVDSGDAFQGTLFFNQWQGEEAAYFMNALGYQAMAVGNHELDSGPGTLGSFIRAATFPVLAANVDASLEPELQDEILPYAVLTIGGEQIGVIGLAREDTPVIASPGPNLVFGDAEAAAALAAADLEAQGVNKIVVLSHQGYDVDRQLAAKVAGIDVVVSGHGHTLLGDLEGAAGPYPTVVTSPTGETTLVVSDYEWGRYLGRLDVTFSDDGQVQSYAGRPIPMDESVAEDASILAAVAKFAQPIGALTSQVVGESAVALDGTRDLVRSQETNLGDLICDAMLWQTAAEDTQVCLTNGGGIRSSIDSGSVSMGEVLEVLPFGNQIATFTLSGADLKAALENGISEYGQGTGRFPQVGGMRFAFDPAAPAGSRVTSVEIEDADGSFSPLAPAQSYRVVTNDYLREGGDGYTTFAEKGTDAYDGGAILADAVADYIARHSPVSVATEGRIAIGAAATATPVAASAEATTPAPEAGATATPALLLPTTGAASQSTGGAPLLAGGGVLLVLGAAAWRRAREQAA